MSSLWEEKVPDLLMCRAYDLWDPSLTRRVTIYGIPRLCVGLRFMGSLANASGYDLGDPSLMCRACDFLFA